MSKTDEEILEFLEVCPSKQKAFEYFDIDTNQSYTKQIDELEFICNSVGFDSERLNHFDIKEKEKENYSINPKTCLNCGKPIPYKDRLVKKFCNSSCAAKYNNSHRAPRSEESRKKTSEKLKQLYEDDPERFFDDNEKHYKLISMLNGVKINIDSRKASDLYYSNEICLSEIEKNFPDLIHECSVCGKKFVARTRKNKRYLKKETTCSDECRKELWRRKGKESYKKIKEEGRFQGWKSRNIKSYAEKFWEKVLDNNGICYTREYYYKKYFLDFKIDIGNKILDLEIDGKQHEYEDRKEKDKVRDEFLTSEDIVVYRIKWNEVNSENGSVEMKEKIDKFMKFYYDLTK